MCTAILQYFKSNSTFLRYLFEILIWQMQEIKLEVLKILHSQNCQKILLFVFMKSQNYNSEKFCGNQNIICGLKKPRKLSKFPSSKSTD